MNSNESRVYNLTSEQRLLTAVRILHDAAVQIEVDQAVAAAVDDADEE